MKFSIGRTMLCATVGQPVTGHLAVFSTRGKETTKVTSPPSPPIFTSLVRGILLPFCVYVFPFKDNTATVTPHSEQLDINRFFSLNVPPFPGVFALVRCLAPLYPDVSGSTNQCLCLLQFSVQPYPSEHLHCHSQGVLYPDVVPARYPPFLHVECQVLLS